MSCGKFWKSSCRKANSCRLQLEFNSGFYFKFVGHYLKEFYCKFSLYLNAWHKRKNTTRVNIWQNYSFDWTHKPFDIFPKSRGPVYILGALRELKPPIKFYRRFILQAQFCACNTGRQIQKAAKQEKLTMFE